MNDRPLPRDQLPAGLEDRAAAPLLTAVENQTAPGPIGDAIRRAIGFGMTGSVNGEASMTDGVESAVAQACVDNSFSALPIPMG